MARNSPFDFRYIVDMKHIKEFAQLFENTQELTLEQKDWLDKCTKGTYSFNPQTGLVDINGDFHCSKQGLTDFKGVRFGYVRGFFICFSNRLTSLEGAPQQVGDSFWCMDNQLTTLKGAPRNVLYNFYCSNNSLTSLEGAPQEVGGIFNCSHNSLTSLEGAPRKVGGGFYCEGNPVSALVLKALYKKMSSGKSWPDAVASYWRYIRSDEDKSLLVPSNPTLSPEERRGYEALVRHKKRLI